MSCVCANGYCVSAKTPSKVCCRQQAQACCCEHRCSVPCDEETPCMCTICCVQIFRETSCTTAPKCEVKALQKIPFLTIVPPSLTMKR